MKKTSVIILILTSSFFLGALLLLLPIKNSFYTYRCSSEHITVIESTGLLSNPPILRDEKGVCKIHSYGGSILFLPLATEYTETLKPEQFPPIGSEAENKPLN